MFFRKILVLMIGLAASGAALKAEATTEVSAKVADRAFIHGLVWTGQQDGVDAQAVALKGNKILAVGTNADIADLIGPKTEVIDLGGRFVMPGFIDNHTHFESSSIGLSQVQLRDAATPEEFSRRIVEAAQAADAGSWVLEGTWDHEIWGGQLPDRTWIDEGTGDVPVAVVRLDGHMILANSAALKLAGIDSTTPDPDGGVIVRDGTGRATGILKDNAMTMVLGVVPKLSDAAIEKVYHQGMKHALSVGVTQIHDMGYDWHTLSTFRRLHAKGEMDIRVYTLTPLTEWQQMADFVAANGRGDDWLRWGGLKGFVDGSLGSTTAWFYAPYAEAPQTNGFPITDMAVLRENVSGAVEAGLHVAVHAIGDQANDRLLDIFEEVSAGRDPDVLRFRIEHAQHLSSAAVPRFANLGVTASMHPFHLIDDGRWAEKRLGATRLAGTYAIGSVMKSGANVTFGSDWSVAPLDPIQGIYAAVTRRTTDGKNPDGWVAAEKISVAEALRAYTRNNAYAGFQEDRLGMIKAGYLADLVVLSENPFAVSPEHLTNIHVVRTVVGGADKYLSE